ncbi:transposable element tcb2 transposase [Plakobranchus ocellatus]|uniref:Transposable element tcb2 transposase n=1 Tax=Plakobranchus ocellatus TaxID=259542 RepID=A0AAV3YEP5_9GAST|nr:transposable element tcb2 transposase [Plakobranchus ocellatus]
MCYINQQSCAEAQCPSGNRCQEDLGWPCSECMQNSSTRWTGQPDNNKGISGFQTLRQARAPEARLKPATEGSKMKGVSTSEVARRFHVQRRIIQNLWQHFQRGVTTDLPRSGRPRITCGEDRLMQLQHLRNRFPTAQSTAENFQGPGNISLDTVHRCLHEVGLHPSRRTKKPLLTQVHRRDRLKWDMRQRRWTMGNLFVIR